MPATTLSARRVMPGDHTSVLATGSTIGSARSERSMKNVHGRSSATVPTSMSGSIRSAA
jgi:hypothetical protein